MPRISRSNGTNGSGKSTLLKMIAGLEPIDGGQLFNSGVRIVYLPQQPDLDENHTVLEQVFADSGEQMALCARGTFRQTGSRAG